MEGGLIYHVYTCYTPRDPETLRRHTVSQASWKRQPWIEVPVDDASLERMWREEGKSYPYLRDVFDSGCDGKPDDAIVVYTNADIHVRSDTCAMVACCLQDSDACYAYRCDFGRLTQTPKDIEFVTGHHYAGSDLVAFRVGWWRAHRAAFPDMLIAIEAWDPCMRLMIDKTNPGKWTVIDNILAHERHASFWENRANRYRFGGQKYNLKLAKAFLASLGVNPRQHGIP